MIPDLMRITRENWGEGLYPALEAYAAEKGVKKGAVLWIYRIAITASPVTPGGATEMAVLLGREKTLERFAKSLEILNKQ